LSELESVEVTPPQTTTELTPEREGLPSSYRMRADAHYVDQLTSRRPERVPADIARIEPRRDQIDRDGAGEPRYRRSDRVLMQLSENIATIQSAAALIGAETSPMARRISLALIRSHAWRAGWLFRAHQLLDGLHRSHVRPQAIGTVLAQVRDNLSAECRLTGSSLTARCADWTAEVEIDEDMLVAGLAGAVLATLELAGPNDGMQIELAATLSNSELRTVEVTQNAVRVSITADGRSYDQSRTDRAGNWTASLGATVAKSVAHLTGGEVVFLAGEKRGSTVRFLFR
jgi:hypothetical protein